MSHRVSPLRAVVVGVGLVGLCGLAAWLLIADLATSISRQPLTTAPLETLIVLLAEAGLLGCVLWFGTTGGLVVASSLRRGTTALPPRARGCPEWWRRLLLGACGVAMAGGIGCVGGLTALPANAESTLVGPGGAADPSGVVQVDTTAGLPASDSSDSPASSDRGLDGLPMPDLTSVVPPPLPVPTGQVPPTSWRLEPGDSLWRVAATLLGPDAADARIAEQWHRIFELNRDRLGPDPDLVPVGIVLRLPEVAR